MLPHPMLGSADPYYMDHQHMMMQNAFLHNVMPSQLTQFSTNDYNHMSVGAPMIKITPDAVIADEPIEAGCPGMLPSVRRRRSDSGSLTRYSMPMNTPERQKIGPASRNPAVPCSWETMTDEEREEHQRMRRKEEAYKTALCDAFKKNGSCSYGDACRFAHGENELRLPAQPRGKAHPKYKTQLCDKFSANGHCPYGPRCQFIHKMRKGLSLVEYESLLHSGKISPDRFEEESTVEYQPLPRKGGRREHPSKKRLSFEVVGSHKNQSTDQTGLIYPKMQVINIEKALLSVDSSNHNEDESDGARYEKEEKRVFSKPTSLNKMSLGRKAISMQDLDIHNSMEELHLDTAKFDSQFLRRKELSLIKEEFEDNISMDERPSQTSLGGFPGVQTNKWHQVLRMDSIKEDEKENLTSGSSGPFYFGDGSRMTEAELMVQSCDEELLAQGLYTYRYPNASMDMMHHWQS